MDLRYIVKDFNPTKIPEHIVDSAPINKMDKEISDIRKAVQSINDILTGGKPVPPPEYVEKCALKDEEISKVRSYILEIWKKYFSDYTLSKDMEQMFIWNIPRSVYKTFDDCVTYMKPDTVNPLFWFFMYCIDLTPDVFCGILNRFLRMISKDTEAIEIIREVVNRNEEENE